MNYTIAQFNDTFPPLMDGVAFVVWNYARWLNQNFGTCYAVVPYIPDKSEQKNRLREGPNNMALIDNARQNSQQQEQKRTRIEAEKGKGGYFIREQQEWKVAFRCSGIFRCLCLLDILTELGCPGLTGGF